MARPTFTTIYNGGNLVADLVAAGNASSDYAEEVAGAPPTLSGLVLPTGTFNEGTRFTIVDNTGEAKSEWRYNETTSSWDPLFDIEDIVITSNEFPTRPSIGSVLDRTLYINLAVNPPTISLASGGVWRDNIGSTEIDYGPPQNMPSTSGLYLGYPYVVTEQATTQVPLGLYLNIGGVFQAVSGSAAPQTKLIALDLNGTLTANQATRPFRPPTSGTITGIHADVADPTTDSPTGQPLIFDLEVDDVSVFTDPLLRPTIPVNTAYGTPAVPSTPTFSAFSKLVAKAKQLGTAPVAFPTVISRDAPTGGTGSITSQSIARHPSAQIGDLQIELFYTSTDARVWTAPATGNWSLWGSPTGATGGYKIWIWYRLDDGAAGPWTFTLDAAQGTGSRQRMLVRNVNQTTPVDTASTGTGKSQFNSSFDTAIGPGSIVTTQANVLEVLVSRTNISVTVNPGPVDVGYTVLAGWSPTAAAFFHWATIQRATAGTYAAVTATASASTTSAMARIPIVGAGGGSTRTGANARVYVRYVEGS